MATNTPEELITGLAGAAAAAGLIAYAISELTADSKSDFLRNFENIDPTNSLTNGSISTPNGTRNTLVSPYGTQTVLPGTTRQFFDALSFERLRNQYQAVNPYNVGKDAQKYNNKVIQNALNQGAANAVSSITNAELPALQAYAPAAGLLARSEVTLDNTLNQAEKERLVEAGVPGFKAANQADLKLGQTLSKGFLPSAAMDRAFQLGNQSFAADASAFSGAGDTSFFAKSTQSLFSANQRLDLMKSGSDITNRALQTGQLNVATPMLAKTSQDIRGTPTLSGSQIQLDQQEKAIAANALPARDLLQNLTGQAQFKAELSARLDEYNSRTAYDISKEKVYANVFDSTNLDSAIQSAFNQQASQIDSKLSRELFYFGQKEAGKQALIMAGFQLVGQQLGLLESSAGGGGGEGGGGGGIFGAIGGLFKANTDFQPTEGTKIGTKNGNAFLDLGGNGKFKFKSDTKPGSVLVMQPGLSAKNVRVTNGGKVIDSGIDKGAGNPVGGVARRNYQFSKPNTAYPENSYLEYVDSKGKTHKYRVA